MREERERDLLVEAEPAPLFSNADSFRSIHFYKNSVPAPSRLARQDTASMCLQTRLARAERLEGGRRLRHGDECRHSPSCGAGVVPDSFACRGSSSPCACLASPCPCPSVALPPRPGPESQPGPCSFFRCRLLCRLVGVLTSAVGEAPRLGLAVSAPSP